jgi:hypothetical protein
MLLGRDFQIQIVPHISYMKWMQFLKTKMTCLFNELVEFTTTSGAKLYIDVDARQVHSRLMYYIQVLTR